ncbi:MAG: helix-turn-helix domain-containing protein [Pseudomonadota bacterium]
MLRRPALIMCAATPAAAIELLRVSRARLMLETTGVPPSVVASRCGFRTQEQMRRAFHRLSASRRAGSGSTSAKSIGTRHFLMGFATEALHCYVDRVSPPIRCLQQSVSTSQKAPIAA